MYLAYEQLRRNAVASRVVRQDNSGEGHASNICKRSRHEADTVAAGTDEDEDDDDDDDDVVVECCSCVNAALVSL